MTFALDTHWVWDFWLADDGESFHLYYLHAPRTLGDERLRHRNAVIGHAVSQDLSTWRDLGPVLGPGSDGGFDMSATWTGSVVRGADGVWRMFYTGARFLDPIAMTNVETVGVATSTDLHTWVKQPGPVASADPRWYETLPDGTWREEAWRDPWVFADASGRWHMLTTARARSGAGDDRGVVGHAVSDDLGTWTVLPPLSEPGAGFAHLEVPQIVRVDGEQVLLFSCDGPALAGPRAGGRGGIWAVAGVSPTGPFAVSGAQLLVDDALYAGRILADRTGRAVLLAFENRDAAGGFPGRISDPIPVRWDAAAGRLSIATGASRA
ncbi:MAG: glycosyl hydrolase family 32 [Microbacterium sp.]|nr:glycosyl hydrolase family 32 [Microbacterium sp.]